MSDAAVATIVTGLVTIVTTVCGVMTLWLKLKENTKKLDKNTEITKEGTAVVVESAIAAADRASVASDKADRLLEHLNGKLEDKITRIVKSHTEPIIAVMSAHAQQDDKNMAEIREALGELRDRIRSSDK